MKPRSKKGKPGKHHNWPRERPSFKTTQANSRTASAGRTGWSTPCGANRLSESSGENPNAARPSWPSTSPAVSQARPRILILDPLVRLHGVDENAAGEIAPILAFLRGLQRQFETAVLVVHHARKSGAARAGQALRGSGELFAWCDSMVYVRRRRQQIFMSVEHRAAPARDDIELELATCEHGPALRVREAAPRAQANVISLFMSTDKA